MPRRVIASDTFPQDDGTPIVDGVSTLETGQLWHVYGGAEVRDHGVRFTSFIDGQADVAADLDSTDHEVSVVVMTLPTSYNYLIARKDAALNNQLLVIVDPFLDTVAWIVGIQVASLVPYTAVVGDEWALRVVGETATFLVNGVPLLTLDLSPYPELLTPANVRVSLSGFDTTGIFGPFVAAGLDLRLVLAGDSIASADYLWYDPWAALALPAVYLPYEVKGLAIPAVELSEFTTTYNAALIADYTSAYGANGCWLVIQTGTNDIGVALLDAYELYAIATALTLQAHALGIRVVIGTILPHTYYAVDPVIEAVRQAYNDFVRGNGAGADAVADVASDAVIGLLATTFDPAYYSDGIHPTALASARLRPIWAGALSDYFTANLRVITAVQVRDLSPQVSVRLLTLPPARPRE